jgi:hypothetical protein
MFEGAYCEKCGKEFFPTAFHVYKDYKGMYCSWSCFNHRKDNQRFTRKRIEVLQNGEVVDTYPSAKYAADVFGCCEQSIGNACRNGTEFKGYHWRYANDNKTKGEK